MEQSSHEFAVKREEALGLEMRMTTPAVPVQYEGTVHGRPFYFHARHDEWHFGIADTIDDAVDASSMAPFLDPADTEHVAWLAKFQHADDPPETRFARNGKYGTGDHDAGWMPRDDAEAIIRQCVAEYLAGRGVQ